MMKLNAVLLGAVAALSGCATPSSSPAFDAGAQGRQELVAARQSVKASAAQESKELAKEMAQALMPAPALALSKPSKASAERRFDLSASLLPAPLVYQTLVDQSNYNLILASDVRDPISISLKDVTLREALESLRDAYGYEFEIQGRRVVVSKPAIVTKTFQINYLLGSRSGRSDVRVVSGSVADSGQSGGSQNGQGSNGQNNGGASSGGSQGSHPQETSRVTTTLQNDFWQSLSASLSAMVGNEGGRQVIVNPQAGMIFVKAMPKEVREVEGYLKKTQSIVGRQVMLEAKIIEVHLTEGAQSGINWSSFDSAGRHRFSVGANSAQLGANGAIGPGTALQGAAGLLSEVVGAGGASALGMAFTSGSFSALMSFLETQGSVQVLSTPRVATINNQNAVLKVGTDAFFVTNVSTSTTSTGSAITSSPSISVQPFFSGIALDVTPQIDEEGYVILHIHPSISDVFEQTKTINLGAMGNYTLPLATSNVNETDSVVRVKDSQIVAIGGLMRVSDSSSRSKVPGVGDIPAAGELFKQTGSTRRKSELVILIKPTVINNQSDWGSGLGEESRGSR